MASSKMLRDSILKGSTEYEKDYYCDPCSSSKSHKSTPVVAFGYCSDCLQNLCKSCYDYHPAIKVCSSHKLIDEPRKIIACQICLVMKKRTQATRYCEDCKSSICGSCCKYHPMHTALRNHRIIDIISRKGIAEAPPSKEFPCAALTDKNIDYCAPCQTMGRTGMIYGFCKTCVENMCESCINYHASVPVLQQHLRINEKYIPWCKPCARRGQRSKTNSYCNDCKDHLCNSCNSYHGRISATKHHSLTEFDVDTMLAKGILMLPPVEDLNDQFYD